MSQIVFKIMNEIVIIEQFAKTLLSNNISRNIQRFCNEDLFGSNVILLQILLLSK